MLKLLFTGSAIGGFVLAIVLGMGYNPMGGGQSNPATAAAQEEPVLPSKATSVSDKPAAAAALGAAIAPAAFDPAQLAAALESFAPARPAADSGSQPADDSFAILLDQFAGLLGGKVDFNAADLMKLLGGR